MLLKNEPGGGGQPTLPMPAAFLSGKTIAVFGISANDTGVQQGGYVNSEWHATLRV